MKTGKILDKNITFDNYGTFKRCRIIQNGHAVRFTFACGKSYDVQLSYLLQWFYSPHYDWRNGKSIPCKESTSNNAKADKLTIVKCRRVAIKTAVRIYMSNYTAYDVAWDTVLMACEKKYEHFGGLTKESKEITRRYFNEKEIKSR